MTSNNARDNRSPHRRRRISLWFPVVIWAALIAAATSTPGSTLPPPPIPFFDLVVHVGLYGVLGFLLYRAIRSGTRLGPTAWGWLVAFAIAQIYGVLDEVHQLWIPNRTCALSDGLADGIGAALGIWAYVVWFARRARLKIKAADPQP